LRTFLAFRTFGAALVTATAARKRVTAGSSWNPAEDDRRGCGSELTTGIVPDIDGGHVPI
jgi:hypothetical protein